jgi:hypothetical protein
MTNEPPNINFNGKRSELPPNYIEMTQMPPIIFKAIPTFASCIGANALHIRAPCPPAIKTKDFCTLYTHFCCSHLQT